MHLRLDLDGGRMEPRDAGVDAEGRGRRACDADGDLARGLDLDVGAGAEAHAPARRREREVAARRRDLGRAALVAHAHEPVGSADHDAIRLGLDDASVGERAPRRARAERAEHEPAVGRVGEEHGVARLEHAPAEVERPGAHDGSRPLGLGHEHVGALDGDDDGGANRCARSRCIGGAERVGERHRGGFSTRRGRRSIAI